MRLAKAASHPGLARQLLRPYITLGGEGRRYSSPEAEAKVMIADLTRSREVVYTGPVNSMVRRLQVSLSATAAGTLVGSPVLLHYLTSSSWGFGSQLFFALGGTRIALRLGLTRSDGGIGAAGVRRAPHAAPLRDEHPPADP